MTVSAEAADSPPEAARAHGNCTQTALDLERVLDSMKMGVVLLDAGLKAEIINKEFFRIWKVAPDEIGVGSSFRAIMDVNRDNGNHEATQEQWEEYASYRLAEIRAGDVAPREIRRADGFTMIYSVTALSGGKRLVSYYDITAMKMREKALRESMRQNDLFRHALDEMPVSISIKNADLTFEFVNKTWSALTGVSQQAAIGRTDVDFFGEEAEGFAERDREVLRTGVLNEAEESITHTDGAVRQLIAKRNRLISIDGSVHLIGSGTDVTELKQRETELRDAQQRAVLADRAKSEFLANMSHEIRTPMNGVLGMAELLARSELNSKQKTFTDIIVKSGNALLTIINDILDFSKIDAGQLVLDPKPFNLSEAVEDVATLVSTRAKEKDLELIVRIAPDLHDLFVGDVGRIRQIITNLVGNAVKFTDAGHVLIEAVGETIEGVTDLRITVTDTGIGIPAEKIGLVFEKFSQVDSSSTRRHEGTGLGLAITSRLVQLMGGEVGVESVEGEGSSFWFTLSLPNAGPPQGQRQTPLDVTGARVLIVDDNAVNRAILIEQMASWKFDACAAESGAEGLKVLEAAASLGIVVDCVVLDYQMPGMNGAEMARIVRATPAIAATPIVMLTSVDQTLANASYRDIEIEAQLIKPARSTSLLEALVVAIQQGRQPRRPDAGSPAARSDDAPTPPQPAVQLRTRSRPPAAASRLDILVAEDNEVNQLVFTQILGETDHTFEIVANGRAAVEAFGEMKPRMILMDISMPEMNGLEATAAIRELEAAAGGARVPIIGVTAHALKGDRERCLEAGMDDYLPKPISPRALLGKVERWMGVEMEDQRAFG